VKTSSKKRFKNRSTQSSGREQILRREEAIKGNVNSARRIKTSGDLSGPNACIRGGDWYAFKNGIWGVVKIPLVAPFKNIKEN